MTRPILLSFTATLNAVASGKLIEEHLRHSIFFYRCTRSWTYEEDAEFVLEAQQDHHDMNSRVSVGTVRLVQSHIKQADKQGRAAWRKQENLQPMDPEEAVRVVSQMLRKVNLMELNADVTPGHAYDNEFFKSAIERANNKNGLSLVEVFV